MLRSRSQIEKERGGSDGGELEDEVEEVQQGRRNKVKLKWKVQSKEDQVITELYASAGRPIKNRLSNTGSAKVIHRGRARVGNWVGSRNEQDQSGREAG